MIETSDFRGTVLVRMIVLPVLIFGVVGCSRISEIEKERIKNEAIEFAKLGHAARNNGDIPAAEDYFKQALALNKKIKRTEGMANNYRNLGTLAWTRPEGENLSQSEAEARAQEDYKDAERYYQKAFDCDKKLGRIEGMAGNSRNLGFIAAVRGDNDGARKHFLRGIDLYTQIGDTAEADSIRDFMGDLLSPDTHSEELIN